MTLLVENWDQQDLELPPEFFNGFLSAVRTFSLRGVVLSPEPCRLSKLTAFTLRMEVTGAMFTTLLGALDKCRSSESSPPSSSVWIDWISSLAWRHFCAWKRSKLRWMRYIHGLQARYFPPSVCRVRTQLPHGQRKLAASSPPHFYHFHSRTATSFPRCIKSFILLRQHRHYRVSWLGRI